MRMLKRFFDIVASGAGLVLLSPLLTVIALLIKLDSPGPVLFRQQRVGRHGRLFRIYKFRTMQVDAPERGMQLTVEGDARITRVGTPLRHYKLDELPQLLNVVKGEMSLVGPRPEVPKYVQYWDAGTRDAVLSVRPGMTDLASVEFRHENRMLEGSSSPERLYIEEIAPAKNRLAVHYVERWSIWLDMQILYRTFLAIIR
jgi:lipopolysaccharide/colanic/teichoic acid biosynthesis glycosyltransferase